MGKHSSFLCSPYLFEGAPASLFDLLIGSNTKHMSMEHQQNNSDRWKRKFSAVPVALGPPQISHRKLRHRSRTSPVRDRRLTPCITARISESCNNLNNTQKFSFLLIEKASNLYYEDQPVKNVREIFVGYCEAHTKHPHTLCGKMLSFQCLTKQYVQLSLCFNELSIQKNVQGS